MWKYILESRKRVVVSVYIFRINFNISYEMTYNLVGMWTLYLLKYLNLEQMQNLMLYVDVSIDLPLCLWKHSMSFWVELLTN